ncbi:MAG: polysaccharide pyruvyl transferase family protein [Bacteroidales bacterium]|nr:polysaccharide pyruvyl transferase family protein [Bacteroidales bacterium]
MKIGILTFHFGYNYGGLLQAYGLQQYLASWGHNVKIINYIPPNVKHKTYARQLVSRNISTKHIRKIIKKKRFGSKYKNGFDLFRTNFLNLTEHYSYDELSEISDEFEAIIVGSDQIWNPGQHKLGSYFLSHLNKFNGKRISYSPCCAINSVQAENKNILINALNKFDAISVRNKETQDFVHKLIKQTPPIVVDPVLLWGFDELIQQEPEDPSSYILVYILGSEINGGHNKVIERIKSKYPEAQVISIIATEDKPQLFNWTNKTYWQATPVEWINLFYHAAFIYTDSFHGVLFSIKFAKPFLAYYADIKRRSRFIDLAKRFIPISDNIIDSYNDAEKKSAFEKAINYEELYKLLKPEVDRSISFLQESFVDSSTK